MDLAKWDAALYTEKLEAIEPEQMWTGPNSATGNRTRHYGFGWFLETKNGHHIVEHEGAWQGFKTQISRYVDAQTHRGRSDLNFAEATETIAHQVAEMYFVRKGEIRQSPGSGVC